MTSQSSLPREGGLAWSRGPWLAARAGADASRRCRIPGRRRSTPPYNRVPQLLADAVDDLDWARLRLRRRPPSTRTSASRRCSRATGCTPYPTVAWSRQRRGVVLHRDAAACTRGSTALDAKRATGTIDADGHAADREPSTPGSSSSATGQRRSASDFVQTLEPRAFYVYIPYRDQSTLPIFDTALDDFNFAAAVHREPLPRQRPHRRREPAHAGA